MAVARQRRGRASRTSEHPRDGCVVLSAPLAAVLQSFVDDWNRQRPRVLVESDTVSAVTWLVLETGIPETTIGKVLAAGRGRGNRTTELRIADRLMTAIGRPELFNDGRCPACGAWTCEEACPLCGHAPTEPPTLRIFENELARPEARAECCGSPSPSMLVGAARR